MQASQSVGFKMLDEEQLFHMSQVEHMYAIEILRLIRQASQSGAFKLLDEEQLFHAARARMAFPEGRRSTPERPPRTPPPARAAPAAELAEPPASAPPALAATAAQPAAAGYAPAVPPIFGWNSRLSSQPTS